MKVLLLHLDGKFPNLALIRIGVQFPGKHQEAQSRDGAKTGTDDALGGEGGIHRPTSESDERATGYAVCPSPTSENSLLQAHGWEKRSGVVMEAGTEIRMSFVSPVTPYDVMITDEVVQKALIILAGEGGPGAPGTPGAIFFGYEAAKELITVVANGGGVPMLNVIERDILADEADPGWSQTS